MSQASKQVEWCLKKAKKELEECRKLGKRPKHRGLIQLNPNKEVPLEHIKKSEENLQFALSIDRRKYGYKIVENTFYCIYQCFLAIASKFGYESGNQACTVALIEYLKEQGKIDLDNKFISMMKYKEDQEDKSFLSIIEMREEYTYSSKTSLEEEKINELLETSKEILSKTKDICLN
ncbi:MAG TPA: hypothetical protein VJH20_03820 [Candidatus Nanoarchaeia archaeon]|nr:hypothetical protein [Candidatus Nanoarchaeia archaeon]